MPQNTQSSTSNKRKTKHKNKCDPKRSQIICSNKNSQAIYGTNYYIQKKKKKAPKRQNVESSHYKCGRLENANNFARKENNKERNNNNTSIGRMKRLASQRLAGWQGERKRERERIRVVEFDANTKPTKSAMQIWV